MSDGTQLNLGTGGDVIRDIDRSANVYSLAFKTQVVVLDQGGQAQEDLVSRFSPLRVALADRANGASVTDLLQLILVEMQLHNVLLNELPLALNQARTGPILDLAQFRKDPTAITLP